MRQRRRVKSLAILGFLIFSGFFIQNRRTQRVISPVPDEPQRQILPFWPQKKKTPDQLKQTLEKMIGNSWKNYSILVIDYNSNFTLGLNEEVIFTGASVNKLLILSALYYLVQNGEIDLDNNITIQAADIQDYGTGVIRYDPPGSTYSVKTLARLMMQKSDNTAAYVLANYTIGIDKTQKLIEKWGLKQSNVLENKTSNKDISLLFEKIINGKIANQALTSEMLSFLKNSDFEDRLPAMLPAGVMVYHKIGTEVRSIHDAGVVTDSRSRYYVGIFTTDVDNETETVNLIAKLSKTIYDFMQ